MANELSMDQLFIKKLTDILEANLENEQFGVEELAEESGLSRSQLHRKLNAINGKSTSQFIREYRLEKAMDMLQNNVATASEIAYSVGFNSPTYFNTSFQQYYGYPPGEVKFRNHSLIEDNESVQASNDEKQTITIKRNLFNRRSFLIVALAVILIATFLYYNFSNSVNTLPTVNLEPVSTIENSIAVLPFYNMSGNPENEPFCDGMTNAIISRLSKIKGINKVISQTSIMSYKNTKKTMPEIAEDLKVHYILESGFQKSGDNIKINLQLIDAPSDSLYWSKEYTGKYDSIFKIQAEVAELVATQLDVNLTKNELKVIRQSMTDNKEAYENFLIGKQVFSTWSNNSVVASRKYYEKAIALDSLFAEAYFEVGVTYSVMGIWNGDMPKKEANKLSRPYFEKALQLDPDNPDFLNYLTTDAIFDWNFKKADSLIQRLQDFEYKNKGVAFYFTMGNYDLVIEDYNNLPKDTEDSDMQRKNLSYAFYFKGDIDSSVRIMEEGLLIHPNYDAYYDHFGNVYLAMGNYEKAKEVLETGLLISGKRYASMVIHLAAVYHYLGDEEKSLEYLNEVIDRANSGEPEINVFVAHYYSRLGKNDEAFKWLDRSFEKHEVDLFWLKADPNLLQLKDDPRYKALCKKVGFLDIK